VAEQDYLQLEAYTRALFARGQALARERGLLLVDTKYEFGTMPDGTVVLIDEIHTPDSSRYFEAEGYEERQAAGEPQRQLSKEFVRQWLIAHGFQGQEGQHPPVLPESFIEEISSRYINLYERMTGKIFTKAALTYQEDDVHRAVSDFIAILK
jgi:phosphoribosylaminoimidazole-succinocarboxamide synthase